MWPFKKRKYSISGSGLLKDMTDCHCHILPGVDDGIQTMEEAIATLHELSNQGVRRIWLTPHVMEDIPNTPSDLRTRFQLLLDNYHQSCMTEESRPKIELHLAAEHMIDNLFVERLKANEVLPYSNKKDRVLLVETSYYNPPMHLYDTIEDIRSKGYIPLLAHPERYVYMHTPNYHHLNEMGVKFQLNLLSLLGAYGGDAVRKSHKLLAAGLYTACGTDLHNLDDFMSYATEECLSAQDIEVLRELCLRSTAFFSE